MRRAAAGSKKRLRMTGMATNKKNRRESSRFLFSRTTAGVVSADEQNPRKDHRDNLRKQFVDLYEILSRWGIPIVVLMT